MSKVSRRPLRALRAPGSVALVFALLASLAPLGTAARAQAVTKGHTASIEEGYTYVIEQTPDGDSTCRLATLSELELLGPRREQPEAPMRQINHLHEKEVASTSSAGLTIILRGTPRLDLPENAQAKAAFIRAAAKWEALISTPITVTIDVDYGPDFFPNIFTNPPRTYGPNTLGQTSQSTYRVDYSIVRQRLISRAAAGSAEAALLNSLPATTGLPTDLGLVPDISVPRSMMSALGLGFNEADNTIPMIGFNSNFAFDFDPTDGVNSTQTDFDSVAVHEIGHALGFNSRVGGTELTEPLPLRATVWDFYRFRPGEGAAFSTAQRLLKSGTSSTDQHVHFGGGAELQLSTGKPDGTGGDGQQSSHWKDNTLGRPFIGIMDPTIPRGKHDEITQNDLAAIDFFGYTLAGVAPPPPPPGPPNDHFVNAQAISGTSGSVAGTNVNATRENGEQNHSPANDAGGKSVWYNWTAPSNGSVTFDTKGSNYDTVLAAYPGASVSSLGEGVKNDDEVLGETTTSIITFAATAGTTYRIAVDGWGGEEGSIVLNWSHTGTGGGGATVQFSTSSLSVGESSGGVVVAVTRAGDPSGTATVDYRTTDSDNFTVGCADAAGAAGNAYARCDFATVVGTLRFAPGETQKQIAVPVIDDAHVEGPETFRIELSSPSGAALGTPNVMTVTIMGDDTAGQPNPVMGPPFAFFVRQQYLDFLSRQPDDAGNIAWLGVLNNCANPHTGPQVASGCDRIYVSGEGFFRSDEFRLKGGYAFRFYKAAFNRLPEYTEIVSDMSFVAGATAEEVFARRAELASRFANRQDFATKFGGMNNAEYVAALLGPYGLTQVTTPDPSNPDTGGKLNLTSNDLTNRLAAGTLTRAQVLRAVADSDEVGAREFNNAFVAMQYYGYLRRKPDQSGYAAWLAVLQSGDTRTMVNGFLNSTEYKLRFGQP